MSPAVWVLLQEACEVRGREALVGLFESEAGAKSHAQGESDDRAEEDGRQAVPMKWRADGENCQRADDASSPYNEPEYFLSRVEVRP